MRHVPRLQRKSFSGPDQVRKFSMGHVDIVNLDETSVGRFIWEPGWRWSEVVKPVVDTPSCVNRHLGYVIGGHLHVLMDDGTELDIVAGDAYEIPPGHDAWVVGDTVFDAVEFASARLFGIAPDEEDERTLATILFTDIVDSTATLARLGDKAWRRLLLDHNDALRGELDRFRGREIVTTGDGFLALFDSAARAVRCAAAMTDAVRAARRRDPGRSPHRRGQPGRRECARGRGPCRGAGGGPRRSGRGPRVGDDARPARWVRRCGSRIAGARAQGPRRRPAGLRARP